MLHLLFFVSTIATHPAADAVDAFSAEIETRKHERLAAVRSYQEILTVAGLPPITITYVRGVGSHSVSSQFETMSVGADEYQRSIGGPWSHHLVDLRAADDAALSMSAKGTFQARRDASGNLVTKTVLEGSPGESPAYPLTWNCYLDPATFLTRSCVETDRYGKTITTTSYSRYDDPALEIRVPPEALARPLTSIETKTK